MIVMIEQATSVDAPPLTVEGALPMIEQATSVDDYISLATCADAQQTNLFRSWALDSSLRDPS
jgi:hypothetical protein